MGKNISSKEMGGRMKSTIKAKIIVPAAVFCVTLAGQVFRSSCVREVFDESYISYSLIIALISYFIIDFITASGLLQRKIMFVKLLTVYFALLVIANRFLLPRIHLPRYTYVLQLVTTVLFIVVVVICDKLLKTEKNFEFIQNVIQLPPKYLRPRPVLFILETVFRLFPVPEPVALYKVGSPHKSSPVIVTGSYAPQALMYGKLNKKPVSAQFSALCIVKISGNSYRWLEKILKYGKSNSASGTG